MRVRLRWGWRVGLLAASGGALVVAFVLSFSGSAPSLYERELAWLFWLNVGVALLLAIVLALTIGRLFVRLRTGRFGSRLLLRLAGIFALVGVLPGLVIYTVSYQFAARWGQSRCCWSSVAASITRHHRALCQGRCPDAA